ncbi:MAG: hypothetical protein A3D53_03435 [Candidatus Magasanikbacteria bacterium RIFCSPHIGHO2_02_FULL_45_10]|uniref:DUF192 domain-containing protein n=1 Tax=Candidatus Magasanikbacteria bacterium RIFCSPHIGHO2_02_FULL_45_10 TaxID=1798679 RepID=A0A1F6M9Z3_9BACT|nr:MAG: hypothetical protein A3D53_03435 [Candidatus Magasanikbacteria bacterium RIFCSPHIGHO2_02_FULL_45_10]
MKEFRTFKKWHGILFLVMVVCALFVYFNAKRWPEAAMIHNNEILKLIIADTFTKQSQGLSDRDSLGEYDGMLFPFGYEAYHTIVMRKMRFSLDLIWLRGSEVVDITLAAKPEAGRKERDLTRYSPKVPADAVIEVAAGSVYKWGIQVGDMLTLDK